MKNITNFILLAMLSTMGMGTFTSCTNDDDTIEITNNNLRGVWMHDDRTDNDYDYLQFNTDGTGLKWEVYKNDPEARPHDQESFTYTLSGNKITFQEMDGDRDTEKIIMTSPDVIVIDKDTYNRQK